MPSLSQFARRIRGLGARVERNSGVIVREIAGTINQTIVFATPVDTGRARANWQVGVGSSPQAELQEDDPGGGSTVARNQGAIASAREGDIIYISNNVRYITRLNQGSSAQAPAGFVEQAVAAGNRRAREVRILDRDG